MYRYSVIIPHYNIPDLLERCLNSIPSRDDIQIIIVDDNSNPDVVDFEKFPGQNRKNITLIFNKDSKGAGHARNLALPHAKGKWLVFADSDDFFSKHAFSNMDKYADGNADLILFKVNSVLSDTLEPTNRDGSMINCFIDGYFNGKYTKERVAFINEAPWAKMVSRELVVSKHIDFEEVRYSNDVMFSTKVTCNASNIIIASDSIYTITLRAGSLSYNLKQDPNNFLTRMEVKVRRNKYLKTFNKERPFILLHVINAYHISPSTAFKTFIMILKNNLLLDGLNYYIKNKRLEKVNS